MSERILRVDGAHNVRDLGGYRTASGGTTRWRAILRADGLSNLTAAGRSSLQEAGLACVIDLRSVAEVSAAAGPFASDPSVRYCNIGLFAALAPLAAITDPTARFEMADRYRQALAECQPQIAEVMGEIAEAPNGAVLFHCTAGKDRTGIVAALLLSLAGVSREDVISDYALTSTTAAPLLHGIRERYVGQGYAPALVDRFIASDPATMAAMLDCLETVYGGAADYLDRAGVDEATRKRLLRRLLGPSEAAQ